MKALCLAQQSAFLQAQNHLRGRADTRLAERPPRVLFSSVQQGRRHFQVSAACRAPRGIVTCSISGL